MISKQEIIGLLRGPVYKVEVKLLYYPYVELDHIVKGERIYEEQHNLYRNLFNYIHTQETIRKEIFDKGDITYYLQVRDDEVYEVDDEMLKGLECVLKVGTTNITLGLTHDGLYKLS